MRIKPLAEEDRQRVTALATRSAHTLVDRSTPPMNDAGFQKLLKRCGGDLVVWTIEDLFPPCLVGLSTLTFDSTHERCGRLGYWIGEPYKNQGMMTKAMPLILDECFVGLKLHRIEAFCQGENHASRCILKRAGFRLEGVAREVLKLSDGWRDHERWAMIESDWRSSMGLCRED